MRKITACTYNLVPGNTSNHPLTVDPLDCNSLTLYQTFSLLTKNTQHMHSAWDCTVYIAVISREEHASGDLLLIGPKASYLHVCISKVYSRYKQYCSVALCLWTYPCHTLLDNPESFLPWTLRKKIKGTEYSF